MCLLYFLFFFFNDPATTEIYTLSLHDALPISNIMRLLLIQPILLGIGGLAKATLESFDRFTLPAIGSNLRSEEHTSELQSRRDLVCRLLLEKKNKKILTLTTNNHHITRLLADF